MRAHSRYPFDAILLAGAGSRRLAGADKPMVSVDGRTLLARAISAVEEAERVVVVGPRREVSGNVVWCQEEPVGAGPLAAVAAGSRWTKAPHVVVLAADLPFVAPAVPVLLEVLCRDLRTDVAVLLDGTDRRNYLAAAWRRHSLVRSVTGMGVVENASMRSLFAQSSVVEVPDAGDWATDCDTWDSIEHARVLATRAADRRNVVCGD